MRRWKVAYPNSVATTTGTMIARGIAIQMLTRKPTQSGKDDSKGKRGIFACSTIGTPRSGPSVKLRRTVRSDRFEVKVRDNGIGIREADLSRLFREFEQLDSGAARLYGGTGLGLALTKKIVEFQKGVISVESGFGVGSTFTVVLPNIAVP